VDRPHSLDIVVAIASLAFVGVGFTLYGVCGGGVSLVLFGAPAVLFGFIMGRYGALALIIPCVLIAVTLIGAGLYVASTAGCLL